MRRAQLWLHDATIARIDAYLRTAVVEGRLSEARLPDLPTVLRRSAERRGLASPSDGANIEDPPYAHPFYWGGFTLTGY